MCYLLMLLARLLAETKTSNSQAWGELKIICRSECVRGWHPEPLVVQKSTVM